MSEVVIKVENIGKQYRIGQVGTGTISHDLNRAWLRMRGKEDPYLKIGITNDRTIKATTSDLVWALQGIDFEVKRGEVLGIIGKNGAGKSTLLKVLSQITSPTVGEIKIKGRIAALLEVGTGFHPDLTGRENVFLNGAILGMTKSEIKKKFDEIVEFSGVEKYIDTPVKRYSSGMMVRLGFAVAAHLEPEILIVDEVLAVGDAEFQKKCLGKMKDVSGEGRTILFVSHNMAALSNLCTSALVLKNGEIDFQKGNTAEAVQRYLAVTEQRMSLSLSDRKDRNGAGNIQLVDFKVVDATDKELTSVISGQHVKIKIGYKCKSSFTPKNIRISMPIFRSDGLLVTLLDSKCTITFDNIRNEGCFLCEIHKFPFNEGLYYVNLMIMEGEEIEDWIVEAESIHVEEGDFYGTGRTVPSSHKGVLIEHKWMAITN
jgi:lipopolysaccharide transport system ATP-binding protein